MNSEQPNEPPQQLSLWEEFVEQSQNIQRDDSTQASIEKSALDENHALMEEIVDEIIIEMAWARVKANRGAPGPDGITLEEFPEWFRPQWETVRQQLLDGTYRPATGTTRFHRQTRWRHSRARHSKLARPCDPNSHRFSPHTDLRSGLLRVEFRLPTLSLGSRCSQASADRSFAAVAAGASIWICRNSLTESNMTC